MKKEDDYYDILGVKEKATTSEIRRAYKDLSMKLHPDKHPADQKQRYTEAFCCMKEAYEELRDNRELYDLKRRYNNNKTRSASFKKTSSSGGGSNDDSNSRRAKTSSTEKTPSPAHEPPRSTSNSSSSESPKSTSSSPPKTMPTPPKSPEPKYSPPDPSKQKVYGTCFGAPCGFCKLEGKYCFQHEHQDPRNVHMCGSRADGQPCPRCQSLRGNKFCFEHKDQDTRKGKQDENKSAYEFYQPKSSKSQDESSNGNRKEHIFGTHADGKPCLQCQLQYRYCFEHEHQDPRHGKHEPTSAHEFHQQKTSQSFDKSGSDNRKEHLFGTRTDGQPWLRYQSQGKYCYQHQHQDPCNGKYETKPTNEYYQQPKSNKSHVEFDRDTRKVNMFGTRADGQPCLRCQSQGKYCYQHEHQDPRNGKQETNPWQGKTPRQSSQFSNSTVFGRRRDGQPCQRCLLKGFYCHQHLNQQYR